MDRAASLDRFYFTVCQEGLYSSRGNLRYYLHYLFQDTTFVGRKLLDVGCGAGLFSFYVACCGASQVTSLEPEAEGSSRGMVDQFQRVSTSLGLNQINLYSKRFQDFDPGNKVFDIILLHNSINHLDEVACANLQHDNQAVETYRAIFQKLSNMASHGAKLIIADCSRHNFFALCHLKNPFGPTMEWHKHQSPGFWAKLLSDVGFRNPKIRWTSFNSLRSIGRMLFGNRVVAFFLQSHFCLTMEK
jgi:SAM-dependent methyltransferase